MATGNGVSIEESWSALRENPIFRRNMAPKSMRAILRNPLVRALSFSVVAVLIFNALSGILPSLWLGIGVAVMFWTIVTAIQHYFCWAELMRLSVTGTLDDYLNSGFSAEDIAIGLIYPAILSGFISYILFFSVFFYYSDSIFMRGFFIFLIIFMVRRIFSSPSLFYPDVEDYLRSRSVLALWFIGLASFVPILIWFSILYPLIFGLIWLVVLTGVKIQPDIVIIVSFFICMFISKYPLGMFHKWRLKRFYRRYSSIEDLLRKFQEQAT